jgi:hypothetical protein
MKKLNLFEPHPNLRLRLDGGDLGGVIAELLQSLYELEEQLESAPAQITIDQAQFKKDQEALLADKTRLIKFRPFIVKLTDQIKESGQSNLPNDYPLPKRRSAG